ncbi:MAG TPA: Hpt domain-containing protein [Aestuariivirgaceae bacterium]
MTSTSKRSNRTRQRLRRRDTRRADAKRLDLEHLRRYTLGDHALENELLGLFRVQARVQLDVISIATLPADYHLAVHTLKGAALVIGANSIVSITRELERIGFPDNASRRRELILGLAEEISEIEAAIAEIAS